MAKSDEYDKSHPLPPASGPVMLQDMRKNRQLVESYNVGSWCPTPDGSGKPTMVHLTIELPGIGMALIRFKTAGELRRFIGALSRHMFDVWPESME